MDDILVPVERIESAIRMIRGQKVMLSSDLAFLYGVQPRVLVQAVKRNAARFPPDFMFQLTREEWHHLKSQNVISSLGEWGGARRAPPYAFTEQGVAMLSSVLHSARAVRVNIEIMRAFVRMRRMLADYAELNSRLEDMERKYDAQFKVVFDAIRRLIASPSHTKRRQIGFHTRDEEKQLAGPAGAGKDTEMTGHNRAGAKRKTSRRFVH
ncbi:ORF6N domain-containing protein [Candidatus Sumerlaeota bacterium]|nr:ORF6N domain-containing protein [Candidatus Sumerlaeota bacterium]